MTRFLIQLISRVSLICLLIVLIPFAIGRTLPSERELLFSASFNLNNELNIYRMSMERQITVAVTHNPANDFLPDWSPDGQQIAFVSDRDGNYSIYITDAQGNNTRRLFEESNNQYNPVWSPDGKHIAYITESGGYGGVMLYDMAAGTIEALTDTFRTHVDPVWKPDGKSVTFVSDLDERWNTKIYSVDIASRVISPIFVGGATNPVWSPDGRYLLYIAGVEKVNLNIWDDLLKKSTVFYTGDFVTNDTPAWSADGQTINYSAFTINGNHGIFQLPVSACLAQSPDCIPQALTSIPALYRSPKWKPLRQPFGQ